MKTVIAFLAILVSMASAELTLLKGDGATKNRIRLFIVGDGFTTAQKSTFIAEATKLASGFAANETYFSQFAGAINIYAAFKASEQSGADHPLQGKMVTTAFDGTFGSTSSLERLVTASSSKVIAFLKTDATNYDPNYDITIVLVNDTQYGGSGGQIATTTLNSSGIPVAIHEIGHSFARLTDEYDYQPEYSPKEAANATAETRRDYIKWAAWVNAATPIPTPETSTYNSVVGLFEGACYRTTGWFRPWNSCMMKDLSKFCPVCTEEFVFVSYKQISPIEGTVPAVGSVIGSSIPKLSVLLLPLVSKPSVQWIVNGAAVAGTSSELTLASAGLKTGTNTVWAIVKDNSGMVKIPSHFTGVADTAKWSVTWSETGTTVALTVNGGSGTGSFAPGTAAPISAVIPSGKSFVKWVSSPKGIVADSTKASTTVTVPATSASVTAEFKEISTIDTANLSVNLIVHGGWESGADTIGSKSVIDTSDLAKGVTAKLTCVDDTPAEKKYAWANLSAYYEKPLTGTTLFKVKYSSDKPVRMALNQAPLSDDGIAYGFELPAADTTIYIPVNLFVQPTWIDSATQSADLDLSKVNSISFESTTKNATTTFSITELKATNYKVDQVALSHLIRNVMSPVSLNGSRIMINHSVQNGVVRLMGFNGRILAERIVGIGETVEIASLNLSAGAYLVQVIGKSYQSPTMKLIID